MPLTLCYFETYFFLLSWTWISHECWLEPKFPFKWINNTKQTFAEQLLHPQFGSSADGVCRGGMVCLDSSFRRMQDFRHFSGGGGGKPCWQDLLEDLALLLSSCEAFSSWYLHFLVCKIAARAFRMTQCVKVLAVWAWRPECDTQNPHKGERREPAPQSCPLTFMNALRYMPLSSHTDSSETCPIVWSVQVIV